MSPSKTALIVGGNRGIGLNLVKALSARNWFMVASVRPQTSKDNDPSIKELAETGAEILEIDVLDETTIIAAAEAFGPTRPLDMLINCAGIGPEPDNWYEHTGDIILEKFRINSIGPFRTSKHFHPNLKLAKGKIINVSSNAGSISMNKGEDLGYRMSKAALNQLTATMAKEFIMNEEEIAVVSIYPGYVATKMTNYRSRDNMAECIEGIVKVVESVGMEQTGTFVDWKGQTLPW